MDKDRPGMGVREQIIIINSLERTHTVANMEGSMRALERTLTEVEHMGHPVRPGRGDSEARLLEGLQGLSSVVNLELANLGALLEVLFLRTC